MFSNGNAAMVDILQMAVFQRREVVNELPNGSQVIPGKNCRTHCDRLTEAVFKSTHYSAPQREDSIFGAENGGDGSGME